MYEYSAFNRTRKYFLSFQYVKELSRHPRLDVCGGLWYILFYAGNKDGDGTVLIVIL